MVNSNKVKAAMVRAGYTQAKLANAMNIGVNTLNAKINGRAKLYIDEADQMCKILSIDTAEEKVDIFLA